MLLKEECFKDGIYKEPGKEKEQEGSFLLSTSKGEGRLQELTGVP